MSEDMDSGASRLDGRPHIIGNLRALIWLDARDSHFVHLTVSDDRLVLPETTKRNGLHLGFNDNPRSANFHPVALARCLEAMRRDGWEGLPAHDDLFIRNRHINQRDAVIEEYERHQEPRVPLSMRVWVRQSISEQCQREIDTVIERYA